jgi:hypothetical protein
MGAFDALRESAAEMALTLETEFGEAATYTKEGADTVLEDGTIVQGGTPLSVVVWPAPLNQQDMARKDVAEDETRLRNWQVRKAAVGEGLATEDTLTIGAVTYEVLDAVLDPFGLLYTLHTRQR